MTASPHVRLVVVTICVVLAHACTRTDERAVAGDPCRMAAQVADDLEHHVLPFWARTVDGRRGGYVIERAEGAEAPGDTRQLVTQARLVWSFSRAHRAGFGGADARYLAAARAGYTFLATHFHDSLHGGYYWMTDRDGHPSDTRKVLYGQAFAMFALSEYARASGDGAALDDARRLFDVLERHARDQAHGGWLEHFTRDWQPIVAPQQYLLVEVAGLKSANTHLHMMEALTGLAEVAPSASVTAALREALAINRRVFFAAPERAVALVAPDWSRPRRPWTRGEVAERARELAFGGTRLSYGHNVEFAWMAHRAETVLGLAPDWPAFDAVMAHALAFGFDRRRGGLFDGGYGRRAAWFTGKTWWAQAELLTALSVADARRPRPAYADLLAQQATWVMRQQADPATRVWRWSVSDEGHVIDARLAHDWKTAYHDLRATLAYLAQCRQPRLSASRASR